MTKNNNFSSFSVSLMALYTHFFRFRMELSMWFVERWLYTCWTLLGEFYFIFFSSMKAWFGYVTRGKRFLRCELLSGWSIISDPWEFRAFGNDGEGVRTSARAYDSKGWVSSQILYTCLLDECCMYNLTCYVPTSTFWWFINAYPRRSPALIEK